MREDGLRERAYQMFFDAIVNCNLRQLIEKAYGLLGYPCLVNDDWGHNLEHMPLTVIDDVDFDYLVKEGKSTDEHYAKFYNRYVRNSRQEYPIYICDGEKSSVPQWFSVLRFRDHILGFSAFLCGDSIDGEEREIIKMFNAAVCSILIARRERGQLAEERGNHTLNYLLTSPEVSEPEYQKNAKSLTMRYKPPYCVIRAKCMEHGLEDAYLSQVFLVMKKHVRSLLYTDLNRSVYYLVCGLDEAEREHLVELLEDCVDKKYVHISISVPFEHMEDVQEYYYQTKLTMHIGERNLPDTFAYRAMDFMPLQMYWYFAEQNNNCKPYVTPMLAAILEHDKKYKTEYYQTLWVYIYCFLNIKEAAEMLHIHQNTMHYRVDRLTELFHIDFKDYYMLNIMTCGLGLTCAMDGISSNYILANTANRKKNWDATK